MTMLYQRTISRPVSVMGIGLHSGKKVTLNLYPAEANFGIQFRRTDLRGADVIRASTMSVGATENATSLGNGKYAIHTVEHLLSTFYGLGIDNVYCEVSGPEIPIMDGSSAPFVFLLKETGIANLNQVKKFIVIKEPVRVEKDDKWAELTPNPKLVIDSSIVFAHPLIKKQRDLFEFSCENFINDISRARTFVMLKDVDMLKRKKLALGGSLDNAIVLDDYKVINPVGLRMKNEFVRHKILDTLGDMSLLGHEIIAQVTTFKSGHNLHNLLCRKLLETPSAYEIVSSAALKSDLQQIFSLPLLVQASV